MSRLSPRRTVRLRLTLVYGGLFLASGAALLAITYLLVRHSSRDAVFTGDAAVPPDGARHAFRTDVLGDLPPRAQRAQAQAGRLQAAELHRLLVQSGIALAIMAVLSVALGWLVAGRVLAPLRSMIARTRRISHDNLHERLAIQGPSDELTELGRTIDGLLERLEAAFDAQRRFVANASHELRTPLAMMRTSLDVASGGPGHVPAEVTRLDRKLREGLDRADRLVDGFLALSRAEHGALRQRAPVALVQLVEQALGARRADIDRKGLSVETAIADVHVTGSHTLLSHMVDNVIENAVRHNHAGGWIHVRGEDDGALSRLCVESSGSPLDEAEVQELVRPFQRLGPDRTDTGNGVGLGLSIVAAVVNAHGGSLHLHARPRGGLRVVIELPRADRPAAAEAAR